MKRIRLSITIPIVLPVVIVLALLLLPGRLAAAEVPSAGADSSPLAGTVITVESTADDYTDGYSKTCLNATPCTLRRAINQAHNLSAGERPVTITFDIPITDPGYNSTLGVWKIEITGSSAYDLRELYGETIIDGDTQPGGRENGPKIIVNGMGNHNNGFILRQGGNIIRGIAMQDFKTTHITMSSNNNEVEDCWFGLSDDGTTLSSGDDTEPEGGSGVAISANMDGNEVRDSVFAGFFGVAAAIRGDNAVFSGNRVGMRADGTVPVPAQFDYHPCLSGAWVGGSGITIEGNDHQIGGPTPAEGNIFAGLFLDLSPTATQSPAMDVSGTGHTIQNNVIGLDVTQELIGVCGRGLDFASGPQDMMVSDNTIVQTGLSAIVMNNNQLNGNTLRANIIRRESPWPGKQGFNDFSEDAIAFGPHVPDALRSFQPAMVTEIDGTSVSGTSGDGSPCPLCVIEVFLDDNDMITETLQSLALVTADASGNWSATLPAALGDGEGLRTTSTVPDTFTIIGLDTGTTSRLSSDLYGAVRRVFLPVVTR